MKLNHWLLRLSDASEGWGGGGAGKGSHSGCQEQHRPGRKQKCHWRGFGIQRARRETRWGWRQRCDPDPEGLVPRPGTLTSAQGTGEPWQGFEQGVTDRAVDPLASVGQRLGWRSKRGGGSRDGDRGHRQRHGRGAAVMAGR